MPRRTRVSKSGGRDAVLRGRDFERLTRALVSQLGSRDERLQAATVASGPTNHVRGASGFQHQVDVSVRGDGWMLLLEAKCWRRRIGPEVVLTLAKRVDDIQGADESITVYGSVISQCVPAAGAVQLGRAFGIDVAGQVTDLSRYAIRLLNRVYVGIGHEAIQSRAVLLGGELTTVLPTASGSVTSED